MNKNYYDKEFTLKDLYEQFDDRDIITFDQIGKYRFIYVHEDGDGCGCEISVVHEYEGKYYETCSSHCSCYEYAWDPIEVEEEYLKKRYPQINLDADLFGRNTEKA